MKLLDKLYYHNYTLQRTYQYFQPSVPPTHYPLALNLASLSANRVPVPLVASRFFTWCA